MKTSFAIAIAAFALYTSACSSAPVPEDDTPQAPARKDKERPIPWDDKDEPKGEPAPAPPPPGGGPGELAKCTLSVDQPNVVPGSPLGWTLAVTAPAARATWIGLKDGTPEAEAEVPGWTK